MNIRAKSIFQLSEVEQAKVKQALVIALSDLGLEGKEFTEALENGMNSKLSDLSDTIDITEF